MTRRSTKEWERVCQNSQYEAWELRDQPKNRSWGWALGTVIIVIISAIGFLGLMFILYILFALIEPSSTL